MEDKGTNGSRPPWNFRPVFVGWVPTVLGALSFRSIGQATFPSRAKYANISVLLDDKVSTARQQPRRRVILAFQSRNTSDDFFSSLRNIFGGKKAFYFVLWAHTDPSVGIGSEKLHGEIFVFSTKEQWKAHARTRTREIIGRLNDLSLRTDKSPLKQTLTEFDNEAAALRKDCSFHVKFSLLRNGEVSFGELQFVDQDVQEGSQQAARELNYDLDEHLVNQCFFFLRDLAHNHQHHAPDCDTLLTLQRYDPAKPDDWKKNIVYALQYYVIDSKRQPDKSAMADALGILAYRSAFIENVVGGKSKIIPNDEHLRDSLRARIEDEPAPGRLFASAQTILSMYAILIALIAILLQPVVDGDAIRERIGDDQVGKLILFLLPIAIVEYLPQIFIVAFLIGPLLFWVFSRAKDRKAPRGVAASTLMDLYALGQILSKPHAGFLSLLAYYRITLILVGLVMIWQGYQIARSLKQYFL
ncbi:MAG: hypothetical protein ING16_00515 [Roseomonas sp.]|nr:hypothetical protein [Roseomonas sp.]MCA3281322.1 hypothetical protein [Roseomonas sp.]MCA3297005.1 hypothetical protein [Roseomonas sp.]